MPHRVILKRVAKYLFRHRNGNYYSVVRGCWRSLRTTHKREAKRLLREQLGRALPAIALGTGVVAISTAHNSELEAKVDALTEQLEKLTAALAREHQAAAKEAGGPDAPPFEEYEQKHLRTLCDTIEPRSREMYQTSSRKMLEALRAQCSKETDDSFAPTTAQLWEALRTIGPTGVWNYWKDERKSGGSGLNHLRCYLNQFITAACDDELLPDKFLKLLKRIPIVQIDPAVPTIPSLSDMDELLKACRSVDEASGDIIDFAAYTGARPCNIELLEWDDVKMAQRLINFTQDGTREAADLSDQAYELLLKLKGSQDSPTGKVFHANDYRFKKCRRIMRGGVKGLLKEFPELKDMTNLKSLRHYFASVCVMAGIDFKTVALWLGHNDGGKLVASTYGHLRREHTKTAMSKIRF